MTPRERRRRHRTRSASTIASDREPTLIVDSEAAGRDADSAFEQHPIDDVIDADRVVVTGPKFARTRFERAYAALTRRRRT